MQKVINNLEKRMKEQYENRTRYFLPRRTYTIIRLDGKAFHTFTKGLKKPYDQDFIDMMDSTALFLCEEIQGVQFAYVQSDEISLLLTDFEKPTTDAWFDGNIQKITSVSASMASAIFNNINVFNHSNLAFFDSRVFTIPDAIEVENYFIWRQKDAIRNSIAMTAQSLYSHKELIGKSKDEQQDMIHAKGGNWNNMPDEFKRGRMIIYNKNEISRNWSVIPAIDILKERETFRNWIPKIIN